MRRFWIWRRHTLPMQQIGFYGIMPVVQSVGIRWPGGGWLWQFPVAVEVGEINEDADPSRRMPIPDPTRTVVWFLCALALIAIVITALSLRQSRRRKKASADKMMTGGNNV